MFTKKQVIIGIFSVIAILVFSYFLIAGNKERPTEEYTHSIGEQKQGEATDFTDYMELEFGSGDKKSSPYGLSSLRADKSVICLEVRDRMPLQETYRIPSNKDKIFCWTLFLNGEGKKIRYIWQIGESVSPSQWITITSNKYRVWCPKKIDRKMRGHCRVDIVDEHGRILKSLDFEITPPTSSKLEIKYS